MNKKKIKVENLVTPPCSDACPAGVDVPGYIRAVRDGEYDVAVAILREKLPLPTVCADACFAPCENVCAYRQFGDPIAIRAIKRAAMDKGGDLWKQRRKTADKTGKKIAIVGAGPAGLSAAYCLAIKGHDVSLMDAFEKPGGTLRYGIPDYRIPEERLDKDVDEIMDLGVTFQGQTLVGRDRSLDQLKTDFDAIFIACGASSSSKIQLEGSEKQGVLWGLDFLREAGGADKPYLDAKKVVVIGGGNVAMDVALTARRLGAATVDLFCLETREEMPAHEWEIARAEEENIVIHNAWGPKKILGEDAVSGLTLAHCAQVFDDKGQFNPVFDVDITCKAEADCIILAIGQTADLGFLEGNPDVKADGSRILVNSDFASDGKGFFAGGDIVSGPDSIITAISHGRKAAAAIDAFLGGDGNIDEVLSEPKKEILVNELPIEIEPRSSMPLLKPWERQTGFAQVEMGFSDEQIRLETNRCLDCDAREFEVILNPEYCKECGYCEEVCDVGTFGPADFFNEKGYRPEEVKSSEWCVGCFKCFFACPDFAIDVKEVSA